MTNERLEKLPITPLQRDIYMFRMAKGDRFSHTEIAHIFGCSAEYVGQCIGRRATLDASLQEQCLGLLQQGLNMREMAAHMKCSISKVRSLLNAAGLDYHQFAPARWNKKRNQVKLRLQNFIKQHPGANFSDLAKLDRSLYALASRYMSLKDWRKELQNDEKP